MSREAYTIPETSSQAQAYQPSYGIGPAADAAGPVVRYICGECNSKVSLGRGDAIRCKECGHRVLYKERTKRMVQFEAR